MATPVYTVPFFRQTGLVGEVTVDIPSGQTWVVRDVDAYASVSALGRVDLFVMAGPDRTAFVWFNWSSGEQNAKHWEGRQAIVSDTTVRSLIVRNDGGDPVDVSVTGYRFA